MAARRQRRPRKASKSQDDTRLRRNPARERRYTKPEEPPDPNRFYVVEKIIANRFTHRGEEFLVRWLHYDSNEDSWEPRHELEVSSMDLIRDFKRIGFARDERDALYCICKKPYDFRDGGMIQCNSCTDWFHFTCVNINMEEANSFAAYYCPQCKDLKPHLNSKIKEEKLNTFVGMSLASQASSTSSTDNTNPVITVSD